MGLFGKKKGKPLAGEAESTPRKSQSSKRQSSSRKSKNGRKSSSKQPVEQPPSMELIPEYVKSLATAADFASEEAASALRALFALSEHNNNASTSSNREELVHAAEGQVVPTLLDFLRRSDRNSSEQYLALLVLNNVSIPAENKKMIAVDCGGAHILSRLLCEDPSCHLMAIILVNLTFADAELRRDLVSPASTTQLVDALAYALIVATSSPEIMETLPHPTNSQFNPRDLLAATMTELKKSDSMFSYFNISTQQFPETARWCLCAIKNLTRPSKDPLAAHAVIDTGIIPLILRIVTINRNGEESAGSSSVTPKASEPLEENPEKVSDSNNPMDWEANSMQDAALFSLLNLSTTHPARHYLKEVDAVHVLSMIADFPTTNNGTLQSSDPQKANQDFQCLKARMALAYLVGGEGHYGQSKSRGSSFPGHPDESVLLIMANEAAQLEELLSNTLHQRAKEGPGGYSAATFTIKGVLFGIRCLLTNTLNQNAIATTCGVKLNCLLMKALAQHAIQRVLTIDAEAAEHAAFSLYLLSSFGFSIPFLANNFVGDARLAEKVLTSYLHMENITPAGQHAADQVLLRLPYLKYTENPTEDEKFVVFDGSGKDESLAWDYDFDEELLQVTGNIMVEKRICGAEPMDVIFNRPILRRRAPKKNQELTWEDQNAVTVYPNALLAVQDLSFGSTKVRHIDAIDDILIANNIANSANGEKTESYNYMWNWQDTAEEMARLQQGKQSQSSLKGFLTKMKSNTMSKSKSDDGPFSIFGLKCGPICASDNVLDDETLSTLETRQSQKKSF